MTTASNVRVGVTGAVYGAPTGTALPTSATASLNAAFEELGYLTEDGIRENNGSEVTDIKAWQNAAVVRSIQTSHTLTYHMTFMETSDQVLETFYGNYENGTVEIRGELGVRQSWVLHVEDGDDLRRIVIPDGQVTETGEVAYVNGEAVTYPVTITCFPDNDEVKAYHYILGAGS
jgi:hypothetical protein